MIITPMYRVVFDKCKYVFDAVALMYFSSVLPVAIGESETGGRSSILQTIPHFLAYV